ncbi:MAG: CRISPR-associated helicase Cas3' [Clostridiales bacterium]|nr:CRISPR-associated helicase Cas3' [Clostridiales bacterium]
MGKTEAGLLWCGNNKCFFVLPLKTAINAMYDRLKKLCGSEFKDRVALIHSDMKSQYFQEGAVNESGEIDFDYCVRSRQLSLPISVCTPDQIFDFVLKYPGYEYKLATASYSKFIVDEIQMYSPDLLAAIIYAIELIHKLGGKIAVVTATLPPFVKNELERVLGENVAEKDFSTLGISRHNVNVIEDKMDSSYILDKIRQIESDTVKKFLIVCNSIDTADKIYSCLSEELEDIEVNLFHAAFTKNDRAKKESAICNVSQDRSKTEVWISTSVVEASLDIDFDILFTELSDLFSLFQRFGRVNRQGLKDFTDYNCFVFTEMQGNAKKYHFTDDTIHSLSKQAIMSVDGIISEETKSRLIEKYLSAEKIKNSDYYKSYCDALEYYRTTPDYLNGKNDRLRNIDREDVIPISVYCANQEEILKAQDVIRSSHSDSQDKLKASEIIMGFTVSTAKYNIDKYKTKDFVDLRYNIIPVINCEYDDKRGMTIVNKDEPNITNEVDNII